LGGMLGWPGSDWGDAPAEDPPIEAEWRALDAEARHTFTHFHLRLTVKTALVPMERKPQRGHFVQPDTFDPEDLPTVMRKAFAVTKGS
ncbi:MAG TPA: NUDIX domain-containing protein, partial [Marivita sp.]|nr:NUDIX domain-containing protein [Marivita sp.]